jgi:hypothetical protein
MDDMAIADIDRVVLERDDAEAPPNEEMITTRQQKPPEYRSQPEASVLKKAQNSLD